MRAGIALGSNMGNRLHHLQVARDHLLKIHTAPESFLSSKVYETSPVHCPAGSSAFLNAAVELSTHLSPKQLLHHLQSIEQSLGRPQQHRKNTPRIIDLDLLYCDDWILAQDDFILPHPRIAKRRFVLQPLADICPHRILPGYALSISQLLEKLKNNKSENILSLSYLL